MAPTVTKDRYPKRKRATIDYDVEKSFADVSDLEEEDEDDGYHSEELGEDSTNSGGSNSSGAAGASASAQASKTATATATATVAPNVDDHDSEYEDATFGSRRKIKKVCLALPTIPRNSLIRVYSARLWAGLGADSNPSPSLRPSSCPSDSCELSSRPLKPPSSATRCSCPFEKP